LKDGKKVRIGTQQKLAIKYVMERMMNSERKD
jgi:hypothetical protein